MKYKVTFKEFNRNERTVYHSGNRTEEEVIAHYGLNDPEIEYYKIEKINENRNTNNS